MLLEMQNKSIENGNRVKKIRKGTIATVVFSSRSDHRRNDVVGIIPHKSLVHFYYSDDLVNAT